MKINDLFKNLKRTINIKETYKQVSFFVNKPLAKRNISDIRKNLKNINVSKKYDVKVVKNKTKNFDAFSKKSFFDNFNLNKPKQIINLELSYKNKSNSKLRRFFYFFISGFKNLISSGRGILFFLIFLFIFTGIILFFDKQYIEYRVNSGYKKLVEIKNNPYNIDYIKRTVNDSKFDFTISNILFTPFLVFDNKQVKNAYHIIKGGKELTNSLDDLLLMYHKTFLFIKGRNLETVEITSLLLNLKNQFNLIEEGLFKTLYHYKRVVGLSSSEIQNKVSEQTKKLEKYLNYISFLNDNFNNILDILGHYQSKRYLIVFQNSDEIRPTGGFMGSMGIINIFRGKITNFEKRDVYAYEWDLKKVEYKKLQAPEGLNKITDTFGLRDANYFVNIENSSKSIQFFIKKAGYDIDGVIYLNQNLLLDFLDKTGAIDFKKLGKKINSKNFSSIMSSLVEAKTYKIGTLGTPKKILFDFMSEFINKLKKDANYFTYIKLFLESIEKRDIIFYSFDKNDNNFLKNIGLNADIDYTETLDFNYPVYTSISGNKSDRYMKRSYKKNISINNDCSIRTNLEIISKHSFGKNEEKDIKELFKEYNIKDPKLLDIQGAGDNYQFVRVLLPKNSIISNKKDIIIIDYKKIKVAEFYVKTKKTETTRFNLDYTILNKDCRPYEYKFYKQSGIKAYNLSIKSKKDALEYNDIKKDFYFIYK